MLQTPSSNNLDPDFEDPVESRSFFLRGFSGFGGHLGSGIFNTILGSYDIAYIAYRIHTVLHSLSIYLSIYLYCILIICMCVLIDVGKYNTYVRAYIYIRIYIVYIYIYKHTRIGDE